MKELQFIQVCPDDDYYLWQVQLWLESLKERGYLDKAVSLIFTPKNRVFNEKWRELEKLYPESKFVFYKDEHDINALIGIYIPIIRPYTLMRYFNDNPELNEKAIFYCDSDILFTERFDISKLIDNDICYVSNTLSYINATYFDSKVKDVIPDKLEEYKERDILDETCKLVGITRKIASNFNNDSGGAQYLLKGIDGKFWEKVLTDCIRIRLHLQQVNKEFFENESKGFQSWCADMWAVLWNLWFREKEVKIVPEMNFAWSTSPISEVDKVGIFHNAGIVSQSIGDTPVFYKGVYHQGKNPYEDPHLDVVHSNEKSRKLANWYYVDKMVQLKNKYKLQLT